MDSELIISIGIGILIYVFYVIGRIYLDKKKRFNKQCENIEILFPEGTKEFTLEELSSYNGVAKPQVFLSIKGIVLDTSQSDFYKPGGSYHVFAGKDCSVALAKMSFESQYMNMYDKTKLTVGEMEVLEDWYSKLSSKYRKVGFINTKTKYE